VLRALTIVCYLAMAIGIAGLIYKRAILASHPAAIALQVVMLLLVAWAVVVFSRHRADGLVTTGPYAYLRHPIYAGLMHFCWIGAMSHFSWPVLAYAETYTAGAFTLMHVEEYVLKRKYPSYPDYRRRVKKVVPFLY
jgi:protein-S-isoprenylcysteine O-methyltransferase Ste14